MAYAVTHIILTIVLIDLYRDYLAKRKFSTWYVLIAGIAGLLPDADIVLDGALTMLLGFDVHTHRVVTHSLLFPLIFLLIGLPHFWLKDRPLRLFNSKLTHYHAGMFFFCIAFGWFMHVALDCTFAPDGNLTLIPGVPLPDAVCPHGFSNDFLLGLDAIILLAWLIHEQWARKIKDFI